MDALTARLRQALEEIQRINRPGSINHMVARTALAPFRMQAMPLIMAANKEEPPCAS